MQTNENSQTGICISTQAFQYNPPTQERIFVPQVSTSMSIVSTRGPDSRMLKVEYAYCISIKNTSSNAFQQNFVILEPMISGVLIGKICYIYLSFRHHQEGIFVPELSPSMAIVSKIGPVSITLRCWRYCYVDTQILLRRYIDTVMQIRRYCYVDMQILSLDAADIVNTVDTVRRH